MATKAVLRALYRTQRQALSESAVEQLSQQIAAQFFTLPIPTHLHVFLPIAHQHEVDTWPIINQLWQSYPQVQIAVSVTDAPNQQLIHYPLTSTTLLVPNRWGIPEPQPGSALPIHPASFDRVLVPLLAVDGQGHRVGYGGGYYDRFLAQCRPDCQKVGVSLFGPVGVIEDAERTDVPLDACIFPAKVIYSPK